MVKEPGGGGGHSLFEGSYPLPNYRPAFPLSALEFYFYRPVFLGDTDHRPLKPYFLNAQSYTKGNISWNEYHVFPKIKTTVSYKLLTLVFGLMLTTPPFFAFSLRKLTAPISWRSPLPLCKAVWQWVAIEYLSAPPGK